MTNAEARCNKSLRPQKPEGSWGRTAQDVHLDSHTAPELWVVQSKSACSWKPVKHDRAWSTNGWVTIMCYCWALHPPWDFYSQILCTLHTSPSDETTDRSPLSRVYTYKCKTITHMSKRSCTAVVHVWWTMETTRITQHALKMTVMPNGQLCGWWSLTVEVEEPKKSCS